jgi:hypothetical protein
MEKKYQNGNFLIHLFLFNRSYLPHKWLEILRIYLR